MIKIFIALLLNLKNVCILSRYMWNLYIYEICMLYMLKIYTFQAESYSYIQLFVLGKICPRTLNSKNTVRWYSEIYGKDLV